MYLEFVVEPRNVRLALCSASFSSFNNLTPPYSCWSVIVTLYNLPTKLCMTSPFMFLTLIIPEPHSSKGKIIELWKQLCFFSKKEIIEVTP